jgi:hypothetical protein
MMRMIVSGVFFIALAFVTLPTSASTPVGDDDGADKRGCCSHHRGVCGCTGGHTTCCDGTQSPTCTCVAEE